MVKPPRSSPWRRERPAARVPSAARPRAAWRRSRHLQAVDETRQVPRSGSRPVRRSGRGCCRRSGSKARSACRAASPASRGSPRSGARTLASVRAQSPSCSTASRASIRRCGPPSGARSGTVTLAHRVPSGLAVSARITVCPVASPWRSHSPSPRSDRVRTDRSSCRCAVSSRPRISFHRRGHDRVDHGDAHQPISTATTPARERRQGRAAGGPGHDQFRRPRQPETNIAMVARIITSGRMR